MQDDYVSGHSQCTLSYFNSGACFWLNRIPPNLSNCIQRKHQNAKLSSTQSYHQYTKTRELNTKRIKQQGWWTMKSSQASDLTQCLHIFLKGKTLSKHDIEFTSWPTVQYFSSALLESWSKISLTNNTQEELAA